MKKVEKEFECIAKFINESRNATIGLMKPCVAFYILDCRRVCVAADKERQLGR